MAQFTTQDRLKLQVFNRDGVQTKLVGNGFVGGLRSFQGRFKEKLVKFVGSSGTTRLYASLSEKSFNNFSTEASLNTSDEQEGVDGGESHEDDESVYESDELSCFRGLVLDIAYRPVNVVCWKRAICLEFMEKADVLEYYDQTVNSPNGSFYIPAVLRVPHLLQVVKRRRIKNTLSRKNILHRDNYSCQYCSSHENLTIDHVVPASRGGDWRWENLVAACVKCNSKKGQKTLGESNMKLLKVPKIKEPLSSHGTFVIFTTFTTPKEYDILAIPLTNAALRMLKMRKGTPEEWHPYLAP